MNSTIVRNSLKNDKRDRVVFKIFVESVFVDFLVVFLDEVVPNEVFEEDNRQNQKDVVDDPVDDQGDRVC